MKYGKTCGRCARSFTFGETAMESLSRVEQMIAAKENLNFANMVKVTCPHCGTPALTERSQLRPVADAARPAPPPAPAAARPALHCTSCEAQIASGKFCQACQRRRTQRQLAAVLFWAGAVLLAFLGFGLVMSAWTDQLDKAQWVPLAIVSLTCVVMIIGGRAWRRRLLAAAVHRN